MYAERLGVDRARTMNPFGALQKAGVLLALDGLHPPSMGARISFDGGRPTVTDGPFAEAKEVLGGYWMIQVKSREEAIEWAKRCPMPDGDIVEVRQVQEFEDFPPEVQKAASGKPALELVAVDFCPFCGEAVETCRLK